MKPLPGTLLRLPEAGRIKLCCRIPLSPKLSWGLGENSCAGGEILPELGWNSHLFQAVGQLQELGSALEPVFLK